jgi:Ras-related protein Rab-8A
VFSFLSPSLRIDFKIKTIVLQGLRVKLQIWDTAGQERFRTITNAYYRGSAGILLVYDVTDIQSFNDVRNWLTTIQQHADPNVQRILVGNKCDLVDERQVTTEQGREVASTYGIKFFETSAKSGLNVATCFTTLAQDILAFRQAKEQQAGAAASSPALSPDGIVPLFPSRPDATTSNKKCCK